MKRFIAIALVSLVSITSLADELTIDGPKVRSAKESDCTRLVSNAREVVKLREQGVDKPTVFSALLRPKLMDDEQYRATLPLLIGFVHEAFGNGRLLTSNDLAEVMSKSCRASKKWIYF